jgi:hypothetical protein
MGKNSYLWGLERGKAGKWHALLVHDPEYIMEDTVSDRLTRLRRAKEGEDADPVTFRRLVETRPGTAQTKCGLGAGRAKEVGKPVVRLGIPLAKIGVDPDADDSLCGVCEALIMAEE